MPTSSDSDGSSAGVIAASHARPALVGRIRPEAHALATHSRGTTTTPATRAPTEPPPLSPPTALKNMYARASVLTVDTA
ncbi:hypothetical protein ACFQX7_12585 [Luedemannella flava]